MRVRLLHRRLQAELAKSRRSQNAWALKLGLDRGHFSKLVNGRRRYPGPGTRKKLLEGLGLEFDDLFVVEAPSRAPRPRPTSVPTEERMMTFSADIRYALRMMRNQPGFAATVILIVALGVGANSAVFSLVDAVLLRPLPYEEAERLVLLWSTNAHGEPSSVSFPDYLDWSEQSDAFESMAAFEEESFILGGDDGAERLLGEIVTAEYFRLLGVDTAVGRLPTDEEPEPVVILGDGLAERRYGDVGEVVGRAIDVNDRRYTVIGVMPKSFAGLTGTAELWVPMTLFDVLNPQLVRYDILADRGTRWHSVVGRLRPGVTLPEAEREMAAISASLSEAYPDSNEARSVQIRPVHDELVADHERSLVLLSAAVGVLLLLACVNLANLFLTRILSRRGEVAIRVALGANRARLVRQLLTETSVFALVGGAAGFLVAGFCLRYLVVLAPVTLPSAVDVGLDLRVFGFAFALSVVFGIAFGLLPALTVCRAGPGQALAETGRSGFARRRALSMFAFAQVAIATLLLVGAGLILRSFHEMKLFDPGFVSENLLTMRFHVPPDFADVPSLERVLEEAAALPGVTSAALASHLYFGGGYMSGDLTVEGFAPSTPTEEIHTYRHFVTEDYFRTMGIPVLRGRGFGASQRVAVVNEAFAKRMWPNEDATGKRIAPGSSPEDDSWRTIVGVVGDVAPRLRTTVVENLPQVYFPVDEGGEWSRCLVVRTEVEPETVVAPLRRSLTALHPGIALFSIATMDELLSQSRASLRYVAYLMGAFAVLALMLAALGLYGVITYAVGQLTREIGVRMVVGATRRDVVGLVMRRAIAIAASGLAAGLLASVLARGVVNALLYEVDALDVIAFGSAVIVLGSVVLAASFVPARRAASIDPVSALRHE